MNGGYTFYNSAVLFINSIFSYSSNAFMNRSILILSFLPLFFISCQNSNPDDAILTEAPYDKLTDSISHMPNKAELYFHRAGLLYSNNQFNYAERDLRTAWNIDAREEYALSLITLLKTKSSDSAINFIQDA